MNKLITICCHTDSVFAAVIVFVQNGAITLDSLLEYLEYVSIIVVGDFILVAGVKHSDRNDMHKVMRL